MKKSDYSFILAWAKKIKAIDVLGGCCTKCQNPDPFVLEFHHRDEKENEIADIRNSRWSEWEKEITKCDLLCSNCHRESHHVPNVVKSALLKLKNATCCETCSYDGSALEFHHCNEKRFNFGDLVAGKSNLSFKVILDELLNVHVLCRNCHRKIHIDVQKFRKFSDIIYAKAKNLKKVSHPLDPTEVRNLLDAGESQIQIARLYGCAKSTVCGVVKKHRLIA